MDTEAKQANAKAAQLKQMADEVRTLEASPLFMYRQAQHYLPVIGEGNIDAQIMFIGEAPGEQEAKRGRPFVGASGRFLDELLQSIKMQRADVYITNIVKDRPPENRDPTQAEIRLYAPFLLRQIDLIQPRVIVTLGRFAMDFILEQFQMAERGQKISAVHGQLLQAHAPYGPLAVVPLYHPAVALYTAERRQTLLDDFQVLKQFA
ncbi:MAG: uracil-DNA glycosylase [Caldilineaceae bacterium]